MSQIAELRAALHAAEEAERKAGQVEYVAMAKAATFEWEIEVTKYGFRVNCRWDSTSREAFATWRAAFPTASPINMREPDRWHGMSYILGYTKDGQPFLQGGGGSIILALGRTSFDPAEITREQAAQFEAGIIPEELKKPW